MHFQRIGLSFLVCSFLSAAGHAQMVAAAGEAAAPIDDAKVFHLLNRITYGPGPGDAEYVRKIGIKAYIDEQLNPQTLQVSPRVVNVCKKPALTETPLELFMHYGKPTLPGNQKLSAEEAKERQKKMQETYRRLYEQVSAARIARAVESSRQLEELMCEFWFNHFNIYSQKGLDNIWVGSFEETAIRPHALGKFRSLLGATAHHPAMLFYLDNWQNSASNLQKGTGQGQRRFAGLNENYARELMELHTLGVDGGYTQKDVVELARILTGLGLPPRRRMMAAGNQSLTPALKTALEKGWFFDSARHDFGDKVLLGRKIKGTGEDEVEQALDLLAKHPSTAKYVSYKLAQFFVADSPPQSLVEKISETFRTTDGDVKEMLKTLLYSDEFWDARNIGCKYKSPYRFVVSTNRATGAYIQNYKPMLVFLRMSGMPLYGCVTPDGYKNTKTAWLNGDSLIQRISLATAYGSGRSPGAIATIQSYDVVAGNTFAKLSPRTENAIATAPEALRLSLVLGSPEFMMY